MAKNSGTVQEPLTEQDWDYARMLLAYSKSLETKVMRLEDFEELYWVRGRATTSAPERSSEPPSTA